MYDGIAVDETQITDMLSYFWVQAISIVEDCRERCKERHMLVFNSTLLSTSTTAREQ